MNNQAIRWFMDKITFEPHPEYVSALKKDPEARISKVEVSARAKPLLRKETSSREHPHQTLLPI